MHDKVYLNGQFCVKPVHDIPVITMIKLITYQIEGYQMHCAFVRNGESGFAIKETGTWASQVLPVDTIYVIIGR